MTVSKHTVIAVLKCPEKASELVIFARNVVDKMSDNHWFPTPTPDLKTVSAATDALADATAAALSMAKGLVAARHARHKELLDLLGLLRAFVQSVANANLEFAHTIITSAGMHVKTMSYPVQTGFAVTPGDVSGAANIRVPSAGKRIAYHWQMSADGGLTWITLPATTRCYTSVPGLVPEKEYLFRHQIVDKNGPGDWSEPLAYRAR